MPESAYTSSDRPCAVDDVEIATFDGEIVVFHVGPSMVHKLTGATAAVWLMCDGANAVADLGPQLTELFDLTAEDAAGVDDTVHDALGQLERSGLLADRGALATPVDDVPVAQASDGSAIFVAPPDP